MHSAEPWILLFTTNYSKYLQCQICWLDLLRKPENLIKTCVPLLDLQEVLDDRTHAFEKSQKKNLRSMLYHNPLLSDRTEDEDKGADVDVEEVTDVENSLRNNDNTTLTTNSVFTIANPDISLSIVPNCQTINLVLAFNHKVVDLPSGK